MCIVYMYCIKYNISTLMWMLPRLRIVLNKSRIMIREKVISYPQDMLTSHHYQKQGRLACFGGYDIYASNFLTQDFQDYLYHGSVWSISSTDDHAYIIIKHTLVMERKQTLCFSFSNTIVGRSWYRVQYMIALPRFCKVSKTSCNSYSLSQSSLHEFPWQQHFNKSNLPLTAATILSAIKSSEVGLTAT